MDGDSIFSIPSLNQSSPPADADWQADAQEDEVVSVNADHSGSDEQTPQLADDASEDMEPPASDQQMEDEEEAEAPSPKSVSSDLSDKAFGEYMEAKIGLRTDGSGWMGEGEARAMRRGPVLFGDIPSQPIPHADFRKLIIDHLDRTDWMYENTTATHPMIGSLFGNAGVGGGGGRRAIAPIEPIASLIGQGVVESAIRVTGERRRQIFEYDQDPYEDTVESPAPLEGDFEGLAVRERLGLVMGDSMQRTSSRDTDIAMT